MAKIIKFAITGGIGFVLDFLFTWLFKEKVGINPYLANAIGFSVAVVNNFYINKKWTFNDRKKDTKKQFSFFVSFSLIGLLLNTLCLLLFTSYFALNFYVSKLIAIALVFIWNYNINNIITFKKHG